MGFITPAVAAVFATVASTATTIVTSEQQSSDAKKAREAQRKAGLQASQAADDVLRKEQLLSSRQSRLRQRRAAGSGQGTILSGGVEQQAETGRNVLLGQ